MFVLLSIYISMFVTAFLAATVLPFGSEPLFIYYSLGGHNLILLILVASIGNFLGSLTNYYIGLFGNRTILSRYIKLDKKQMTHSKKLFDKYGNPILFFSWVPIIGDALTIVAGILGSDLKQFYIYVFSGKLVRYILIAILF